MSRKNKEGTERGATWLHKGQPDPGIERETPSQYDPNREREMTTAVSGLNRLQIKNSCLLLYCVKMSLRALLK